MYIILVLVGNDQTPKISNQDKYNIQGVPKLFIKIITGGREHQNKYVSLWYILSLKTVSDARDDLHRR